MLRYLLAERKFLAVLSKHTNKLLEAIRHRHKLIRCAGIRLDDGLYRIGCAVDFEGYYVAVATGADGYVAGKVPGHLIVALVAEDILCHKEVAKLRVNGDLGKGAVGEREKLQIILWQLDAKFIAQLANDAGLSRRIRDLPGVLLILQQRLVIDLTIHQD